MTGMIGVGVPVETPTEGLATTQGCIKVGVYNQTTVTDKGIARVHSVKDHQGVQLVNPIMGKKRKG